MNTQEFLERIKGQLIVSCQALSNEPLYGPQYMAKMALAAKEGGAIAIRANGVEDITAIKQATNMPIIGLIKQHYSNSPVYITPSIKEIQALIDTGVEVIALDATNQERPFGKSFKDLVQYIREKSTCLIMGDISTFEEGKTACEVGVDLISTTLSSYTIYTKHRMKPDFPLIEELSKYSSIPVIAEGNISTPEEAAKALRLGAYAVVVGTAISRPQIITKQFYDGISKTSDELQYTETHD